MSHRHTWTAICKLKWLWHRDVELACRVSFWQPDAFFHARFAIQSDPTFCPSGRCCGVLEVTCIPPGLLAKRRETGLCWLSTGSRWTPFGALSLEWLWCGKLSSHFCMQPCAGSWGKKKFCEIYQPKLSSGDSLWNAGKNPEIMAPFIQSGARLWDWLPWGHWPTTDARGQTFVWEKSTSKGCGLSPESNHEVLDMDLWEERI